MSKRGELEIRFRGFIAKVKGPASTVKIGAFVLSQVALYFIQSNTMGQLIPYLTGVVVLFAMFVIAVVFNYLLERKAR